jgi:hypothetical protein
MSDDGPWTRRDSHLSRDMLGFIKCELNLTLIERIEIEKFTSGRIYKV